jgi:hypothetical protein
MTRITEFYTTGNANSLRLNTRFQHITYLNGTCKVHEKFAAAQHCKEHEIFSRVRKDRNNRFLGFITQKEKTSAHKTFHSIRTSICTDTWRAFLGVTLKAKHSETQFLETEIGSEQSKCSPGVWSGLRKGKPDAKKSPMRKQENITTEVKETWCDVNRIHVAQK